MNIQLKPEQEKIIQAQIASGKYNSVEEIVDVAFKLFDKLQSEYAEWIEETRQKVDVAVAELERGEGLDGETVIKEILYSLKERVKKENKYREEGVGEYSFKVTSHSAIAQKHRSLLTKLTMSTPDF